MGLLSLLLLFLPIIFIILKLTTSLYHLPPGPKPWPIIGNIPHINKKLHISLTNLSKLHGPLTSVRLGTQLVIVGSSPMAAMEILKNQDPLLSARYVPKSIPRKNHVLERIALVWNPACTNHWKSLRALCRTELFSAQAIESQAALREKKLSEMLEFLGTKQGEVVNIGEVVFATVFDTISNLLFSKDLIGLEDKGLASGLKGIVWKLMELSATPNIADFYPIFAKLDPQGLRRKMSSCLGELFGTWEIYIKERREKNAHEASSTSLLDVFLSNGFDDDQINWLIMELLVAGSDTTTTTVEWAMAELLKNKQAMKNVQEELHKEINTSPLHDSQVCRLPCLNACIKETLRLHPPAPLLLHRASKTCEVMNYTIPKDSQVLVNVWAIGRDPSAWEDPLSFRPERFIESNFDIKGHDFKLLPFGSGRRICPGLPMAMRQLCLILASLTYYFDWSLPNGEDPATIDMKDKFGITLQKEQPLLIVPKRKF